jgi:hypothetical protein
MDPNRGVASPQAPTSATSLLAFPSARRYRGKRGVPSDEDDGSRPFQKSFPDMHIEIVELIAEGSKVVGRFCCSGTHLGDERGHPGSGRRFENVDEVYIFEIRDGKTSMAPLVPTGGAE